MRLSEPATLHSMALYALPIIVASLGLGLPGAVIVTVLVVIVRVVVGLSGLTNPADSNLVELHTITYSHYVEKVRWCLDATGVPYREVPSVGILGLLLTGRTVPLLVLPASRTSIGDSPQILRFLWGAYSARLAPERCRFLEPTPEALVLEKHFDQDLGVNVRLWSYWHLLKQRDLALRMWGLREPGIPNWQTVLLPWLYPLQAAMVTRMLDVTESRAAAGLEVTKQVFAEVDALLADGRRYLMGGDEMTFVDITFASLAALALLPDGYGGNAVSMRTAPLEEMAPAWRTEIEALRATEAGKFVARLYKEERFKP